MDSGGTQGDPTPVWPSSSRSLLLRKFRCRRRGNGRKTFKFQLNAALRPSLKRNRLMGGGLMFGPEPLICGLARQGIKFAAIGLVAGSLFALLWWKVVRWVV